ncbi:MAG: NADH-quinone oxidoreductase subunit I [candidate division Zixibacteria bacterium]|nr:NADH-quinone oxidoreductase subunit I [candidate division Zixibacteria bacterium]
MGVVKDLKNLVKGLGITGKHLGRHAITIQYPEERWTMPERSRGIVVLLSDKNTGELNCTSCELCMKACPSGAIKIEYHRDENKKKVLDLFDVDNGLCCFCGLCEEACNFSAIKMATKYEFSVWNKDGLIWDKDRLQEVGRDVPYVDTRRKKKATPKPAESDTSAAESEPKPESSEPSDENKQPKKNQGEQPPEGGGS